MNTPLSAAASQLLDIAARSHSLCTMLGLYSDDGVTKLVAPTGRSWLVSHPKTHNTATVDPERLAARLSCCSEGEALMLCWLLNVWNPSHARKSGWTFDLFTAVGALDSGNIACIAEWLQNPVWP